MNKTVRKVFLVIGVLVLCLVVWVFVFGSGIKGIYNAVKAPIDGAWKAITGQDTLLPDWDSESGTLQGNMDGVTNLN